MGNGSLTMTKFTWSSYIHKIYNETSQVRKEIFEREGAPGHGCFGYSDYWSYFGLNPVFDEPDGTILIGFNSLKKETKIGVPGHITCRMIKMTDSF